ncbi:MAG TPA: glycosyltransferase family 1 protein [Thermoanaerobaculia bacterium]|jgi:glycosyltransferase involved in cell wall biosynthesis
MRVGLDARKIADFGIGTYIRGLLHALAGLAEGEETYVAFGPASIAAQLPAGVEHVVVDAPHYSVRELFAVGRAADGARLDVFHAPHYVVPFTKVPVVVTVHDLIHLHQPQRNPIAPVYARMMLTRAVRKATKILTVSETVKRELIAELRVDAQRIVVTPNGVDAVFQPATGHRPASTRYFLYSGNDKPHKNVATLIEAFTRVRRELPDVALVLTGGAFERYHAQEGVVAPGFVAVDELAALYRGALAVVLPSLEEGFGLPAAEAMACGVAVITSDAPALVEVTGDAALHAAARSPEAFAGAMLRIARDANLRDGLAAAGVARAASFTWKRCAELTRGAYRAE